MCYPFLPEESDIIRSFDISDRETLLSELRQALPDIYQPDTKRAVYGTLYKLEDMTDEEFDALGLDDDALAWEDYE